MLNYKYGDCKDRAYMVSAIARKHGIRVNMALLSTEPRPWLSEQHIHQYNHVICEYDDNGKKIFFDPTQKYCEFGNLPESDIGREVLVLDPNDPGVYTIPAPNRSNSIELDIKASLNAPREGKARITLRNDYFSAALRARNELTGVDLENYLSNLVTSHFKKISLDYFEFDSQQENSITFTANADLGDYIISSSAKKYLPQMPFQTVDADILKREKDTMGIYTGRREGIIMTIDLDISGYSTQPSALAFGDAELAKFASSSRAADPAHIILNYELSRTSKTMFGESKSRYLSFCKESLKSKKNMFVLTRSTP